MLPIEIRTRPQNKSLSAHLRVPDDTEECPILQEPIASATLDSFPRPYLAEHPDHKAIVLPCNHAFHAMSLIYHWARNGNVLCPICRAGPRGQRLVMNHLPKEWRYSMSARVRREQRKDIQEREENDRRLAVQSMQHLPSLELDIRIEAEAGATPVCWTVRTHIRALYNTILFEVPPEELRRIPYPPGTLVRLVPYTPIHMLRPSNWFSSGTEPGNDFSVSYSESGYRHMHLAVSEELFAMLVADVFIAQRIGEGVQLLLAAYP